MKFSIDEVIQVYIEKIQEKHNISEKKAEELLADSLQIESVDNAILDDIERVIANDF